MAEDTCVYRLATVGSWTNRMSNDSAKQKAHTNRVKKMLMQLDIDTSRKYHDVITKKIKMNRFAIFLLEHDYKSICEDENKEFFMKMSVPKRLIMRLGRISPKAADLIWKKIEKVR